MMYIWIGILIAWFVVLLCMARHCDKLAIQVNQSQQRKTMVDYCNNIEQYMRPKTCITFRCFGNGYYRSPDARVVDEAALVDALKDENIVYRGCTR